MLDTIAIKLERHHYKIHEPARFSPNAAIVNSPKNSGNSVIRCVYNPTSTEKAQGYLPRLTLFKKPYGEWGSAVWLKIEFSAPKLVLGNNFEELEDDDFKKMIVILQKALTRMGIETTDKALIEGKVTAIHYSKNIMLDRYTPCFLLMKMLEKADMTRRLDVSQSLFRNGGQMVTYHAKTFEIVLYDKVKDLEQAQKFGQSRGVEKDYDCQPNFNTTKAEVLRFEIRLGSAKLKNLLATLNIKRALTMDDLFSASLSRSILLHYWAKIIDGLYIVNFEASACEDLVKNIRAKFPKKRPTTVMALMGFVMTGQQIGVRGARQLLGLSDSQFYKLNAEAKKLDQGILGWRFQALNRVKNQLDIFTPLSRFDLSEAA